MPEPKETPTMTPQEVRDKLAELAGHTWSWNPSHPEVKMWHVPGGPSTSVHPIPADSIDAILPLWPEGWTWERRDDGDGSWWIAFPKIWEDRSYPTVPDTGNEADDRARLTVAVLQEARK